MNLPNDPTVVNAFNHVLFDLIQINDVLSIYTQIHDTADQEYNRIEISYKPQDDLAKAVEGMIKRINKKLEKAKTYFSMEVEIEEKEANEEQEVEATTNICVTFKTKMADIGVLKIPEVVLSEK